MAELAKVQDMPSDDDGRKAWKRDTVYKATRAIKIAQERNLTIVASLI